MNGSPRNQPESEPGALMKFTIRRVRESDGMKIIGIFNHYVEHSFSAYPVESTTLRFFDRLRNMTCGQAFYVIEGDTAEVVGFGLLKEHHHASAFSKTAEMAYFIAPAYLHRGLGTMLMDALIEEARKMGITTLLASFSSQDEGIIAFHRRRGFAECGRFERIGRKFGKEFDVVWMQKFI
ncbi:MAG: N-acetyltransferase family protein [Nitrospirota bacterium]